MRSTIGYTADGSSIVIPDVNAGVRDADVYVPLRGNGFTMAVRRQGTEAGQGYVCVGYIDCNQLGFRTVGEFMDAMPNYPRR